MMTKTPPRRKVIAWGFVVHVLLIIAVCDTYFSSPIEHGITTTKSNTSPPAKRVVLFVADGLRAQAIYGENEANMPFLRRIKEQQGAWGLSYTRIPTESRPGHVALLAGIYEDPSAMFKGWQKNPVHFDSVLNESSHAWCWGSPDIVHLFTEGSPKHIYSETYDANMQDFGKKETTRLDSWVFDRVQKYVSSPKVCHDCEGGIYFLHLLGIDTAGHAFKPLSDEYINNIKLVDQEIEKVEALFKKTFPDDRTTFIFTSDHGMTDWGTHGTGLDVETHTPVILWGAGIAKTHENINQVDIAPLISNLAGINYPTNSIGKLPHGYLDVPPKEKALFVMSNTLQLFRIYQHKEAKIAKNSLYYQPFANLSAGEFDFVYKRLEQQVKDGNIENVISMCEVLIEKILQGIDYYQNYYTKYVVVSMSLGFLLWMLYLGTVIAQTEPNLKIAASKASKFGVITLQVLVATVCYVQGLPALYFLYFTFPVAMCWVLLDEKSKILVLCNNLIQTEFRTWLQIGAYLVCALLFITGFYYRTCFTVTMLVIASLVVICDDSMGASILEKHLWIGLCVTLSIFPTFDVMVTGFQTTYMVFGFAMWKGVNFFIIKKRFPSLFGKKYLSKQNLVFSLQNICFDASFGYTLLVQFDFIGSDSPLKLIGWCLFGFPILLILFAMKYILLRTAAIFLGFASFFIMTSTHYEICFIACYTSLLGLWLIIETKDSYSDVVFKKFDDPALRKNLSTMNTLRISVIFMALLLIGFFGTGNIASVNSFDPMWVRCLLTVFSPFKMTALISLKLLIPLLYSCTILCGIVSATGVDVANLLCGILLLSDLMVLYFFNNVKNVGSWLEIGTSFSHFIIMEVFVLGIIGLYSIVNILSKLQISFKKISKIL